MNRATVNISINPFPFVIGETHQIIYPIPKPLQPIILHSKPQIHLLLELIHPNRVRIPIPGVRPDQMPIAIDNHRPRSPHITSPQRKQRIQPIVAKQTILDIIQGWTDQRRGAVCFRRKGTKDAGVMLGGLIPGTEVCACQGCKRQGEDCFEGR